MCPVVSWNKAWILLSPGQRGGSAALGDSEVSVLSPGLSFIRGLLQPLAFAAAAAAAHLPLRPLLQLAQQPEGRSLHAPATHQLQQEFSIQTPIRIKNLSAERCL